MLARRILGPTAALALVGLCACTRADPGADRRVEADLSGGWVREIAEGPPGLEGFDLRPNRSVALLGIFSMNGLGWAVSRGELVISTNTERYPQPNALRLRIVSLDDGVLTLAVDGGDYLAGAWRRAKVGRVAGVVTYLERDLLPPGARVDVELRRGETLVARALIVPRGPVPIAFELSYLPEREPSAEPHALEARIVANGAPLFATTAPVPLTLPSSAGEEPVEVVVRPVPR
ncbi:MAG: YbaY family lipoprotein [Myxococcota bacterium]